MQQISECLFGQRPRDARQGRELAQDELGVMAGLKSLPVVLGSAAMKAAFTSRLFNLCKLLLKL